MYVHSAFSECISPYFLILRPFWTVVALQSDSDSDVLACIFLYLFIVITACFYDHLMEEDVIIH